MGPVILPIHGKISAVFGRGSIPAHLQIRQDGTRWHTQTMKGLKHYPDAAESV